MKKIILAAALLLCTASLSAQRGTIKATLLDITNEEPVAGAVVTLRNDADTTQVKFYTSVYGGVVTIPDVSYGEYTVTFTFLGYKDESKKVKVDKATIDLGKIYMNESATLIDAVVAQGQAMRTSQKGDTVVYNADAFKVTRDADAEALLSKMPGITIIDGEVEAQGETVGKIFVDGKEFFGQDVSTAIKTLPAEMVNKVEVYNKLSDMAEFSGVDDGDGFKAINIVTHTDKRTATFGKMYGTWGITDKYLAGANVNIFSGNHRVSLLGMANNTNQQNFAFEDILGAVSGGGSGMSSRGGGNMRFGGSGAGNFMVRQQDGISQVQSFGLNYSGTWAKKIEVTGSYFFNNSRNQYWSESDRTYINQYAWEDEIYNTSKTKNNEHRFNARLDYKINSNHELMMRPSFSIQNYRNENYSHTDRFAPDNNGDYFPYYDYEYNSLAKNTGFNIGNTLIYRVKIGKPGRTLVTELNGRYSKNDRESSSINNTLYSANDIDDIFKKDTTLNYTKSYNLSGNVMYTEPISEHSQLTAQYRITYRYSDADRQRYNWDEDLNRYNTYYDEDYSNIYNSGYLTQRMGPGYNYRKDKTNVTANIEYQHASLRNEQDFPVVAKPDVKYTFENIVYFARLEHAFNSQNTIRVFANSSTSNPSINQLQDVVDISNIQSVTAGNPNLKPAYNHRISANYNRSIVEKGSTFMLMGHFSVDDNYIGEEVTVSTGTNITLPDGTQLQEGSQYRTYTNMSGNWNTMLGMSYGFPIKAIKSNINFNLNGSLRQTPSIQDGRKNELFGQYYNAGVVIGSNISENLDFTVQYNGGYNFAKNSITENNKNIVHYVSARFKWVTWWDLTFSGNGSFTQNKGITQDYNDKTYIVNLALGKKIFNNKRGEVTFGVNDIFNQKTGFRRNITTNYIENVRYNTLGRYYAVQFVYNLRSYKGSTGASRQGSPDSLRGPGPGGRPPMGPPPGGF